MRRFAPVWALAALLCALPAAAQDIDDLDAGVVLEQPFEIGIEPNTWELSLYVGTMDHDRVLLEAKGIIVDVEDPQDMLFADSQLTGQRSFSPQVRLGRTFGRHLALEGAVGFSIGDFEQSATNFVSWSDPASSNTLTEVEREKGSYFSYTHDLAAVYYPRGRGRLQPYLIGGIGQNFWELDSGHVDGIANSLIYSYGAGLRIVGDDLYSFRIEVRRYSVKIQHAVSQVFTRTPSSDGRSIVNIPVSRLRTVGDAGLTDEQVLAIFDGLKLDPDDFRNSQGEFPAELLLPLPFPELDEQAYDSLYLTAGFTAAF